MYMAWGKHLVVNAGRCIPSSIRCAKNIENFTHTLVKRIDMVAYGKPQIIMFGTGNKKGYTLIQLIETSNICAHFVEETNDLYLDVFSCKEFDPEVVREVAGYYFKPSEYEATSLVRQAPRIM